MTQKKLFCFPFAGSDKYAYRAFHPFLNKDIETISADIPGKGMRINEPPIDNIYDATDAYYHLVRESISVPYCIFGHSLGANIAFLVLQKIKNDNYPLPEHVFFTGKEAPSKHYQRNYYQQSDDFIIRKLDEMGGLVDELKADREYLDFFLPIIRNDFKMHDSYTYKKFAPLNIPFTIIAGKDEKVTDNELQAWKTETNAECRIMRMRGNHFFIFQQARQICNLINTTFDNINTST